MIRPPPRSPLFPYTTLFRSDGDLAVDLGAGHAPPAVLAGDEPALPVARIAVGVVRGLAKDRGEAALLVPAQDAVVGNVAPQHIASVADPDRALAPARAGGKPFHAGEQHVILREARVEIVDRRIRIEPAELLADAPGGERIEIRNLHVVSPQCAFWIGPAQAKLAHQADTDRGLRAASPPTKIKTHMGRS